MKKTPQEKLNGAVAMYLSHPNGRDVSAATGVALSVLYRELNRLGVDKDAIRSKAGKRHWNHALTEDRRIEMAKRYGAGESAAYLAAEYGVSSTTVITAARSLGVTVASRGNKPLKVDDALRAQIQSLWDQGHTQTYIAKQVGVHQSTISALILSGRVRVGDRKMRLSKLDYDAEGGVTLNGEGYRLVHWRRVPSWLKPMCNASGYIPEHRAVMAQMLGRMLTQHETVHHIDGDKLNNNPANLQLRQGRHGKGVVLRCSCCGSTDIKAEEIA